jgi:hypothetical protein
MPAPKHLAAYPDEFFRIMKVFNAQEATELRIECPTHGAAIHLRQLFYTFRTKLYEEAPQVAGAFAKQIQCTIPKGSPQVIFRCDMGSFANIRAQLDAQLGPEGGPIKAPALPPLFPPAAVAASAPQGAPQGAFEAQRKFETQGGTGGLGGLGGAAGAAGGLGGLRQGPPLVDFSNTMHDFEAKLAELGFVPGPAAIQGPKGPKDQEEIIPSGPNVTLPPDKTPTT